MPVQIKAEKADLKVTLHRDRSQPN